MGSFSRCTLIEADELCNSITMLPGQTDRDRTDSRALLQQKHLPTPAYVLSEKTLIEALDAFARIRENAGCRILFALKSCSLKNALEVMKGRIDGFAASSLFEAALARQVLGANGTVHITSPGLDRRDIEGINRTCDYVAFNSLSQMDRLLTAVAAGLNCGIRINPGISYVEDIRYNPCRQHSKLGVPMATLQTNLPLPRRIKGIHFHTNCDSTDYTQLLTTVRSVLERSGHLFFTMEWCNMGGGYLQEARNSEALYEAIGLLRHRGLTVFMEPGSAIIRKAVSLVASVTDVFASDGKMIAVLDTTVNHMPEIFEYGFRPNITQESPTGRFSYCLAGCTCLAGDLFGEFSFDEPLKAGSRLVFRDVGSYALAKAHMFNGVNLPALCTRKKDGHFVVERQFGYNDFLAHWC